MKDNRAISANIIVKIDRNSSSEILSEYQLESLVKLFIELFLWTTPLAIFNLFFNIIFLFNSLI